MSKTITTEEGLDLLKPIKNHLDNNASLDGYMFETFGEELDFVLSQPESHIWTYCEGDNCLVYASGYHLVNRLGYLVTELPYLGELTEIVIHNYGNPYPVNWEGEGDNGSLVYGIEMRVYEGCNADGSDDLDSHYEVVSVEWYKTDAERNEDL
jgi:hypothetical protein